MFVLLLIIFLLYGGCVFWLLTGEKEAFLRTEEIIKSTTDTKKISLVVPFRNEEKNLKALIESLLKINYPKDCYEVIFVNDNSDDNSEEIIYSLLQHTTSKIQYSLYRLRENSSRKALKKKALITGVEHARFSIIATTDADCIIPENWFAAISKIFAKQEIALAFFPVIYTRGKCSIKKW
ncbi:MAG: glycosyltransferase, partial [Bacteroidetes bacterium]